MLYQHGTLFNHWLEEIFLFHFSTLQATSPTISKKDPPTPQPSPHPSPHPEPQKSGANGVIDPATANDKRLVAWFQAEEKSGTS